MREEEMKYKGVLRILLIPLMVYVILSNLLCKANAQSDISIGLSPTSQVLELQPGDKYNGEVVTWNLANETTNYKILVRGFRQIENKPGTAIMLSEEEELQSLYSASSWIAVNRESVELVPNKNEKILYEINVPTNITKGEYHAIISLVSENSQNSDSTAALTTLSSGVPILIKVGKDFIENAELLEFKTTETYYEKPTVEFITKINNIGDTHIAPMGEIVLQNMFNKEIGRIKFNEDSQSLLRDNIGDYTTLWKEKLITKDRHLAVGPIKANLVLTYREFQPGFAPLLAETTFWIIPWKYILIFILAIILIVALVKVRKYKKKIKSS